jgi:hypothetical protein
MESLADVISAAYRLLDAIESIRSSEDVLYAQRALETVAERLASLAPVEDGIRSSHPPR